MELCLERETTINNRTFGQLYLDGRFHCHTLEDAVREKKIKHHTAIPAGRYLVEVSYSPRFKRRLPILRKVPQFTGIRIHPGNSIADTSGCILPGLGRSATRVLRSRLAFNPLLAALENIPGPHWITICHQDSKPTISPPWVSDNPTCRSRPKRRGGRGTGCRRGQ